MHRKIVIRSIHPTRPFGLSPFAIVFALAVLSAPAQPPAPSPEDAQYIKKFREHYPKVEPAPTLAEYATAARFDDRFLGAKLDESIEIIKSKGNNQGNLAWGIAYWMIGYNQMYRNTHDPKYLDANLRCAETVLSVRDDKQNVQLFTGEIATAWSSDKYAKRGRAVFGVHTGMLVYPMLDFLVLVKERPEVLASDSDRYATIKKEALEALAWHDRQWRNGPADDEGHYIMMNQEDNLDGKVKPGNRLSALGRAIWTAWKLTGDEQYKDRALRMGRYIKRRLAIGPDGAYYWPYWLPEGLPENPVDPKEIKGEDSSHAQLTISFPLMLAQDNEVFTQDDVKMLGVTVRNGIARLSATPETMGVLLGSVTGDTNFAPSYVSSPDGWIIPALTNPEAKESLLAFYLDYQPNPAALDLAALIGLTATK
ncbi:MAG: hypothetical protein HUU46_21350 [Candidatus Hydrogenedentes bacterium]|nr:hypothetical protein [Candidatus Hydrogenedentota bacterium]